MLKLGTTGKAVIFGAATAVVAVLCTWPALHLFGFGQSSSCLPILASLGLFAFGCGYFHEINDHSSKEE